MRRAAAAAASLTVGLGVLTSACAHHSPTLPTAAAAGYLQAADEANRQVAAARATLTATPHDLARLKASLLAIAEAKKGLDRAVRALPTPPRTAADVAGLLSADQAFEADLDRAANAATVAEITEDETAILASGQAALAAANRLRGDLGLPPAP